MTVIETFTNCSQRLGRVATRKQAATNGDRIDLDWLNPDGLKSGCYDLYNDA